MKKHAVFAAVAGLFAMSAHAQGPGISASVGTTGLGLHLSVPVLDKVSARVGANAFNYDYSGSTDEVDYDFDLKLKTFDALLDYRPFGGTFRLTTGAVRNGNKVTAQARPNSGQTYTINGRTYSAAQAGTIDGKIDFKKVAVSSTGQCNSSDLMALSREIRCQELVGRDCLRSRRKNCGIAGRMASL